MAGIVYYVLDTETTGLKHNFHELTEISIIRYEDRLQMSRNVRAEKPENASYDALKITGKTIKDLYKGISCTEMIGEVEAFLEKDNLTPAHRCIVAHNASFDRKFLYFAWGKRGRKFPAELWLDTLALSKKIATVRGLMKKGDDKPKFNLHAACDLFGVRKIAEAHNAKDDSRNTYLLLKNFIDSNEDFLELIKRIPHSDDDDE
jgi:DNA polymerase III alpha subunit (gram-positive type)